MLVALCVLLLTASRAIARPPRVLFIGNSLTARNDLPGMFRSMGGGKVEAILKPGASWSAFASDKSTLERISGGNWTHVVLQEQSAKLSYGTAFAERYVWPSAKTLAGSIKPGATLVWYETAAYAGGNGVGDSYAKMQDRIVEGYAGVDAFVRRTYPLLKTKIAPVGRVWKCAYAKGLYSDSTHPSRLGTYLAATAIYRTITNRTSTKRGISKRFARLVKTCITL